MGIEIERKFLVDRALWQPAANGILIRQGYLSSAKERVVRVRTKGAKAFITIKGATEDPLVRHEFEYEIPVADAAILLDRLCERPLLEKTRYTETRGDHLWEIDIFHGDNDGLILAEIELADTQENFEHPPWILQEVTGDPRYLNVNLAAKPFALWGRS